MSADVRLYDSACELLYAAQQLRDAASDPAAAPAVPATIACVNETLEELREVLASLGVSRSRRAPPSSARRLSG